MDLFHAHIGGMDAFARGLLIAQRIIDDKVLSSFIAERYSSYQTRHRGPNDGGEDRIGRRSRNGSSGQPMPVLPSGRQEMLENIINSYIQ